MMVEGIGYADKAERGVSLAVGEAESGKDCEKGCE